MHDDQHAQRANQPQKNEAILGPLMIRVIDQPRAVVVEHGLGFLERHPVLPEIPPSLRRVPGELESPMHWIQYARCMDEWQAGCRVGSVTISRAVATGGNQPEFGHRPPLIAGSATAQRVRCSGLRGASPREPLGDEGGRRGVDRLRNHAVAGPVERRVGHRRHATCGCTFRQKRRPSLRSRWLIPTTGEHFHPGWPSR